MTTTPTEHEPAVPEQASHEPFLVSFLGSLALTTRAGAAGLGDGIITRYGMTMLVDEQMLKLNTDRLGRCSLLDLLDNPEGQVRRWGKEMFRRGDWPTDLPRLEPGSLEAVEARETARQSAHRVQDTTERARLLAEVERVHGPAPTTSKTIADVTGDGS